MNPIPPSLGDQQARATRQQDRYRLVTEDYGDTETIVDQWMAAQVGAAADTLGPPDLSANTLLAASVQLSTPGLYGLGEPILTHAEGHPDFIKWIAASGYWTRMQWVQRMVIGVGDWVLFFSVDAIGRLTIENVYPWRVWTRSDPRSADRLLEVRWLRLRYKDPGNPDAGCDWFFDVYRLDPPVYQVIDADGKDWSNVHISVDGGFAPEGGLRGEAYPFVDADGIAFLPFVFYADCNDGFIWHDNARRGATVGALNSIVLGSFSLHAMIAAALPPVIAVNLKPPPANVQGVGATNAAGSAASRSFPTVPGTMLFTQTDPPEANGTIHQINNSGALQSLNQGVASYQESQNSRFGISFNVQRNQANPTSAAALSISLSEKRERAEIVTPFFRSRDLRVLEIAASLAYLAGGSDWPGTGWTIEYRRIPKSPDEQAAERDQLTWEVSQGFISRVDAYLRLHPGLSREEAILRLRQVAADENQISANPLQKE